MLKDLLDELGIGIILLWLTCFVVGLALNVVIIWAIIKAVLYFT